MKRPLVIVVFLGLTGYLIHNLYYLKGTIMFNITEKSYNQNLNIIKVTGEKFAQSVHEAGLFALYQVNIHGNATFATRLMEAVGRKHDAKRIEKWLCYFGKLGMKKNVLIYKARKDITPENVDAKLKEAEEIPFWDLTVQEHHKEVADIITLLQHIPKRIAALQQKEIAGADVEIRNLSALNEVNSLIEKLTKKAEPMAA